MPMTSLTCSAVGRSWIGDRAVRSARQLLELLAAGVLVLATLCCAPAATATALGCPDVEVLFARGTAEPPGFGGIGQQFIDALRWRVGPRSFESYAVNYPASPEFAPTVDGVIDASNRIRDTAANCPDTQIVLGGFSRGAALMGYVTAPAAPVDYPPLADVGPLPPEVAGHIAAVAYLGKPSSEFLTSLGAPPLTSSPGYAAKTIDLCAPGDPICSTGNDGAAHAAYAANGMTIQAADFAADRLRPPEALPDQSL